MNITKLLTRSSESVGRASFRIPQNVWTKLNQIKNYAQITSLKKNNNNKKQ